jgi:hypothetical protein
MAMYKKKSANNIFVATFNSPGLSGLMLSLYEKNNKTYLILKFVPCIGKDEFGNNEYCKEKFLSTSLDYEGAKEFCRIATPILNGKDAKNHITAQLPCGKDTSLTFEHKQEQNGHMGAYLTITKSSMTIPFKFEAYETTSYNYVKSEDETCLIQQGLFGFARELYKYIQNIEKLEKANGGSNQQGSSAGGSNGWYQYNGYSRY